jgi:voltage-gated potassium channel
MVWIMLRQTLAYYLEDMETPIGRAIDLLITELVLLSTVIFVVETYPISASLRGSLDAIDQGILVLFAGEYLLRLWCAENRLQYALSLYSLLDLVAILPFFLGVLDVRFIRMFRWFRILRLVRFVEGKTLFGWTVAQDSAIIARILFTLFAIIFVYSGLIYQAEHPTNPEAFATFLDAVYFSVVTMTTVGFGDVTPISEVGRLLTVLMIFTGIALIPWQLGDLARQFVQGVSRVQTRCSSCGLALHDLDARFCKVCGAELPTDAHN